MIPTPSRQEQTTVYLATLFSGIVIMGVALGLALWSIQPPSPKPATAPANEFAAGRALALAARLLGDGSPHPSGTAANVAVGERIRQELTALGYAVETQATFGCRSEWATCGDVSNILTRLPGRTNGPAVLLTAHYDSVPAGPGAADDMAGVAVMLEIARLVRAEVPLRHPIIFLFSDGEEPGLLGAEAFVAEHPWAAEVAVVVNLEASGSRGPSILFETTEDNAWLVADFAARAPQPITSSIFDLLYEFSSHNTDLDVYEEAGLPGINFAFNEEPAHYHTPLDSLANLDPRSVQHHGDNALAAVRVFAAPSGLPDLTAPPSGKSVYLDLWPGFVLQWPEPWTGGLALIGLLLWLAVAVHWRWQGGLSWRSLLWGSLVLPLGLLAAGLLGLALSLGISQVTGASAPWYAHPLPMRGALWASALLCLIGMANALAPRAGFPGISLGVWLWWSLLTLLAAWAAPGLSVLFLLPALLGVGLLAVVGLTPLRHQPPVRVTTTLVALFGVCWLWLPFAVGVESGAEGELGLLVGVAVGLPASALTPLLAWSQAMGRLSHRWLVGGALLVLVAAGVALQVPAYSTQRPQRLNLLHVENRATGQTAWLLQSDWLATTAAAPESLQRAGGFAPEAVTALPWSQQPYLMAAATATGAPAPRLQRLSAERTGGARVIQVQLFSPRAANQLSLYVPETAGLQRIDVVGTPYSSAPVRSRDGYQAFHCVGPTCDGITLALHLATDTPVTLFLVDLTFGLPADGIALRQARPPTAVPSGDGDVTLIAEQVTLAESD